MYRASSTALATAGRHGDIDMTRLLLDHNADVRDSVLTVAVTDAPYLFDMLLAQLHAVHPYSRRGSGISAVSAAVHSGRSDFLQSLLACGLEAEMLHNSSNDYRCLSPLARAIEKDCGSDLDLVQLFLDHGIALNGVVQQYGAAVSEGDGIIRTSLLTAISTMNLAMVQLLVQRSADPNLPASRGTSRTPLQHAAELGNKEVVNLLLALGAEVDLAPAARYGGTPLHGRLHWGC